jgi:hypothetical protein
MYGKISGNHYNHNLHAGTTIAIRIKESTLKWQSNIHLL